MNPPRRDVPLHDNATENLKEDGVGAELQAEQPVGIERRQAQRFAFMDEARATWQGGGVRILDASAGGAKLQGDLPGVGSVVLMSLKLPYLSRFLVRSQILRRLSSAQNCCVGVQFLDKEDLSKPLAASARLASSFGTEASRVLTIAPQSSALNALSCRLLASGHRVDTVHSPLEALWMLGKDADDYDSIVAHESLAQRTPTGTSGLAEALTHEFPALQTTLWPEDADRVLSELGESSRTIPAIGRS